MPNLANILGLLGMGGGQGGYQPDPQTMGLLAQLNRDNNGMPEPDRPVTSQLQQQLNRHQPYGLLNQQQSQAPGLPMFAGNPDVPALNASPAGPARGDMNIFDTVRGMMPEAMAGMSPMQLPGARPAVPAGGQDVARPPAASPAAPMAAPAQQQQQQANQPGFFDKLGTAIGSIYGGGSMPGDNLIALGAGLASGPNWGSGLMKGMAMVNANALTAKKKDEEQKRAMGQQMLAQHIARQSGGRIAPEAALGIIQSGNAGQFLTEQFRSPTSEQEYNIYKQSESQAGRSPLSFDQWYTRNKQIESGVGETSFEQGAAKAQVDRLGKMMEGGGAARQSIMDIGKLREISGRFGSQGSAANAKLALGPYAEALGIKVDNLDDIQTFNAIVQRVAPTLREPGSGSTSDIEFKGMLASLPQLSQNPAARTAILDMMEAMARDKSARSEIAGKMLNREIDRQTGEKMLRELPDPTTGFAEFKKSNPQLFSGQAQGGQPPIAGARQAPDGKYYVQKDGKWFEVRQ